MLREILKSKDDNDPRLDSAFNQLSPETKRLFREEYRKTAPERRNERGTIVYLLGRNLASAEDWAFMRAVAGEPPCLSLADCSQAMKPTDEYLGAIEVSLAYPALVALEQAKRVLAQKGLSPFQAREARSVVQAAAQSAAPIVARKAAEITNR